jgi:hypothetical protein
VTTSDVVATTDAATTTEAVTTTAAPPQPPPVGGTWTRVPDLAAFDGHVVEDIVAAGPGYVAVGRDLAWAPQIWTSTDGLDWTPVSGDAGPFAETVDAMWLVRLDGTLVAIGNRSLDGNPDGIVVWTSADGSEWTRVSEEATAFKGGDELAAVTAGGPGLVAIGGERLTGHVAWTSPDGVSWTRIPDDAGVFEDGWITDLTAGGPGLVAVGGTNGDGNDAAVWTSTDGTTWTQVTDSGAFGGAGNQWMDAVTSGPGGLVAVGTSYAEAGGARGAVWFSADGVTWTRVPNDDAVFAAMIDGGDESTMNLFDVAAFGPGYVAVGQESAEDRSVVLVSPDGLTWTRLSRSEIDIWVNGAVVGASRESVLVAGETEGFHDPDAITDMWRWVP